MNLTTKQLWNLSGLCPWSSCSVFRSDSSDFQWGSLVFSSDFQWGSLMFGSHFQWGSLVFSSHFQWESLVLCAFVASWAFLFHILIMRSFSVSVFLWLNVLITMNYCLCFGFGTLLSSSTRMFTEWFACLAAHWYCLFVHSISHGL